MGAMRAVEGDCLATHEETLGEGNWHYTKRLYKISIAIDKEVDAETKVLEESPGTTGHKVPANGRSG